MAPADRIILGVQRIGRNLRAVFILQHGFAVADHFRQLPDDFLVARQRGELPLDGAGLRIVGRIAALGQRADRAVGALERGVEVGDHQVLALVGSHAAGVGIDRADIRRTGAAVGRGLKRVGADHAALIIERNDHRVADLRGVAGDALVEHLAVFDAALRGGGVCHNGEGRAGRAASGLPFVAGDVARGRGFLDGLRFLDHLGLLDGRFFFDFFFDELGKFESGIADIADLVFGQQDLQSALFGLIEGAEPDIVQLAAFREVGKLQRRGGAEGLIVDQR